MSSVVDEEEKSDHYLSNFLEILNEEFYMIRCSHGHLFNDENITDKDFVTFSSKSLFNEKCSNEDVLKLLEHICE